MLRGLRTAKPLNFAHGFDCFGGIEINGRMCLGGDGRRGRGFHEVLGNGIKALNDSTSGAGEERAPKSRTTERHVSGEDEVEAHSKVKQRHNTKKHFHSALLLATKVLPSSFSEEKPQHDHVKNNRGEWHSCVTSQQGLNISGPKGRDANNLRPAGLERFLVFHQRREPHGFPHDFYSP